MTSVTASSLRAPNRSNARPAIGIAANCPSPVALNVHPYSWTSPKSRRTAGMIVATTRIWIATSISSRSKPAVRRPRAPAKTSRHLGGASAPAVPSTSAMSRAYGLLHDSAPTRAPRSHRWSAGPLVLGRVADRTERAHLVRAESRHVLDDVCHWRLNDDVVDAVPIDE